MHCCIVDGAVSPICQQDHLVQLVGYGYDTASHEGDHDVSVHGDRKKTDYWLVRNSWTPLWGEDGYIR